MSLLGNRQLVYLCKELHSKSEMPNLPAMQKNEKQQEEYQN